MADTKSQLPNPGRLFADVLWNTARLPATMNNAGTVNKRDPLNASYDGPDFLGGNPSGNDPTEMINVINSTVGFVIYNRTTGFNCQNPVNCVGGVRYIAMGGSDNAPIGTQRQLADLLELNSAGVITFYGQVDWRAGPDYNPGPISV